MSDGATCTCGSGGHPRPCAAHPDAFEEHVAELHEPHCFTCTCGRRAPVQGSRHRLPVGALGHADGTVSWEEHLLAWGAYAVENGRSQSAERLAERGGFGYQELVRYLGRAPTTWRTRP